MKRLYFIALVSFIGTLSLKAQIKYSEIPKIGDSYEMEVFDAVGITVTGAGQDQTWDFSAMAKSDKFTIKVVDPKSEPEGSNYPDADIAIVNNYFGHDNASKHDLNIHYFKTSSSALTKIGRVDKNEPISPVVLWVNKFGNEEVQVKLPLEFGSKNVDYWTGGFTSLGQQVTWSAGQNTYEVDASGTLKLPGKTLENVLRVKRTRKYISTSPFTGNIPRPLEKKMYEWYIPGIPFPVLTIVENVIASGNTMQGFVMAEEEYKDSGNTTSILDVPVQAYQASVFPNPANSILNVKISSEVEVKEITIIDLTGKAVLSIDGSDAFENEKISLPVDQLMSGVYYLRIRNENEEISNHQVVIGSN